MVLRHQLNKKLGGPPLPVYSFEQKFLWPLPGI